MTAYMENEKQKALEMYLCYQENYREGYEDCRN